jgi:acetyl-CoA carboxylase carboxyl transferase beta subunit
MGMNLMGLFRTPQNELEGDGKRAPREQESEIVNTCPVCGISTPINELWEHINVCRCGYHFRMSARQRIEYLTDEFEEYYKDMISRNILDFPDYDTKLKSARLASREKEAVICGKAKLDGHETMMFVMEPNFMMGSMGTVVGEKITRTFEDATQKNLPVLGITVSGGARMQEGILSLMQMAKTSAAVTRHSQNGNLFIVLLTDPTTGGVTASFAMEGDVILAEPMATVGFAGRRVIEQTIRKKLPSEFQKSEYLLEHGFIDKIVARKQQKEIISKILSLHERKG